VVVHGLAEARQDFLCDGCHRDQFTAFVHDMRHHLVEAAGCFFAGDIRLLAFPERANGVSGFLVQLLPVGDGFVGVAVGHVRSAPAESSHYNQMRRLENTGAGTTTRNTQPACPITRAAWALMVFSIAASPFERVGERCLPSPIALMKDGSVSRMSRALCPE